MIKVRS